MSVAHQRRVERAQRISEIELRVFDELRRVGGSGFAWFVDEERCAAATDGRRPEIAEAIINLAEAGLITVGRRWGWPAWTTTGSGRVWRDGLPRLCSVGEWRKARITHDLECREAERRDED
jgi:hypothetical protein